MQNTLQNQIKTFSEMFTVKKRDNGNSFVIFTDNASDSLKNAVQKAHGDDLPSDWVFGTFADLLQSLSDYNINSLDDVDIYRDEIVDNYVDIYTANLTAWLASNINNLYYLTEALEQSDEKDGFKILALAQYIAIDDVFSHISQLLKDSQNN